ncbi:hypothetical protein BKA83DRAFT_4264218 [Pisolithus microcarpus]|nr:hypothetical protein BKA83DRAFT_4264218 [Pisolithus microcarpus]
MTGNTFPQLRRAQKHEGKCQGAKLWQGGEDSGALVNNHWAEFQETLGGGRGCLGALGDQGNERIGAPNPELCPKSSYSAFLHKKGDSSGTTEANASRRVSIESSRRVGSESRKARGKARSFARNRVCKLKGRRRSGLPSRNSPLAVGSRCKVK